MAGVSRDWLAVLLLALIRSLTLDLFGSGFARGLLTGVSGCASGLLRFCDLLGLELLEVDALEGGVQRRIFPGLAGKLDALALFHFVNRRLEVQFLSPAPEHLLTIQLTV